MLNKELIIKRLALIKHLYKLGLEQSRQVETVAAFSILSWNDSIEMFLKLIAEHHNIKSDKFLFLDYWTHIPSLTLVESMRNLNARRVNIKHRGLLPSKSDIEISRVNTTDFFDQNVCIQLGVDFKDISLLTLINYSKVRIYLEEAQQSLDNVDFENCIKKAAIAFNELLYTYENSKAYYYSKSPFFFGSDYTFLSSHQIGLGREFGGNEGRKFDEFVDTVRNSLEGIQKAIKIISFGIDYRRFVKFQILTPTVSLIQGKHYTQDIWEDKKWTKENCQYCIDFVLDSSIKLQEFDFDIHELEEKINFKANESK